MSVYVDIVRSALAELSDSDYQHRVWTGGGGANEMSSFEECVERLFGDSGLSVALERDQPVYGSEIDGDLRRLSDFVGRIEALRSPDEIVSDPAMDPVRKLAGEILQALDNRGRSGVI